MKSMFSYKGSLINVCEEIFLSFKCRNLLRRRAKDNIIQETENFWSWSLSYETEIYLGSS